MVDDSQKPAEEEDRFSIKKNVLDEWDVFYRDQKCFTHPSRSFAEEWVKIAKARGMATADREFEAGRRPKYDPKNIRWHETWAGFKNIVTFIVGGYCVWYGLLNEPHDNWHAAGFIFGLSLLVGSSARWIKWDQDCISKRDLDDPRHDWRVASHIFEDKKTGELRTRLICSKCHREDII